MPPAEPSTAPRSLNSERPITLIMVGSPQQECPRNRRVSRARAIASSDASSQPQAVVCQRRRSTRIDAALVPDPRLATADRRQGVEGFGGTGARHARMNSTYPITLPPITFRKPLGVHPFGGRGGSGILPGSVAERAKRARGQSRGSLHGAWVELHGGSGLVQRRYGFQKAALGPVNWSVPNTFLDPFQANACKWRFGRER